MSVPCANLCLPWSKHCSEHISYNVSQHLFSYCKWRLCNTPVSLTDNLLFDGYCKHHYTEQQRFDTHQLPPSKITVKMINVKFLINLLFEGNEYYITEQYRF